MKSIKVEVISKKVVSLFRRIRVTPQNWQTVITKKGRHFFRKKIAVTPSVAAPGDTHPSDATDYL